MTKHKFCSGEEEKLRSFGAIAPDKKFCFVKISQKGIFKWVIKKV